jgi:enoyl-CoA hydratase
MIHRETKDRVATLRIEHGKVQALDVELCGDIERTFNEASEWDDVRAIVLTGTGSSFSAGVDLFRVLQGGAEYVDRFLPAMDRAFEALFRCPKPVVAALNGHAIAGGCVLACACDLRIMASGKARIGVPELAVGVPFPWLALEIVRLTTPVAHIQELLYLAETYNPGDALRRGLVDQVVEPENLAHEALAAARKLAAIPPPAFALPKRQLRQRSLDEWQHQSAHDHLVRMAWRDPATHAAIQRYLDATLAKK